MTGPDDARQPQTTGPLRLVRGAIVGSSAVVLGAGGHALASGMTPPASSLAVAGAVALLVGIVMSGRRWRLPSLIAVLAAAQLAFHVLLGGSAHAMPGMPAPAGGSHHPVLMVLAHAMAVVVSAALLERGEDWCWQLVELLTRPLRFTRLAPVVAHAELSVINEWTSPVGRRQVWLSSQQHRGPPCARVA
jgi:hypothetical protein